MYYLQYFVVFATYCLELVLGSISDWLGCIWGVLLVDFKFSVRLIWACVFLLFHGVDLVALGFLSGFF